MVSVGLSSLAEVRTALLDFKKSGKLFIHSAIFIPKKVTTWHVGRQLFYATEATSS